MKTLLDDLAAVLDSALDDEAWRPGGLVVERARDVDPGEAATLLRESVEGWATTGDAVFARRRGAGWEHVSGVEGAAAPDTEEGAALLLAAEVVLEPGHSVHLRRHGARLRRHGFREDASGEPVLWREERFETTLPVAPGTRPPVAVYRTAWALRAAGGSAEPVADEDGAVLEPAPWLARFVGWEDAR